MLEGRLEELGVKAVVVDIIDNRERSKRIRRPQLVHT
jgi:hypothetical protein